MILKISLRPLSPFFFGGEGSFNEAGKKETRRSTYFLKSRYYPQQTGVLGLIRNQLLLQNDLLWDNSKRITDQDGAKVLIGPHGFRTNYSDGYGVIKKIGPVFLEAEDGTVCPPAPLDDVWMEERGKHREAMVVEENGVLVHTNYKEKCGVYAQVQHPGKEPVSIDAVFATTKQVGITKATRPWKQKAIKQTDDAGFYYQEMRTFQPKTNELPFAIRQYVFFLEIEDKVEGDQITYQYQKGEKPVDQGNRPFSLKSGLVEFGGERSTFWMEVEAQKDLKAMPKEETKYHITKRDQNLKSKCLVCLTPSAVDLTALRPLTSRIVSQALSFRFLKSEIGTTEAYQTLGSSQNGKRGLLESKRFSLLDRGSVIYFDKNQETDITNLFNQADFQNIGYNQYCIL